ncbi:MAG: NAD(P)-dependent alcohol dehydrogenase [Firmicutes bacterium]|nr:NAD(P)-dependent alcohol dehydrogenase [Bacillota bacterium]
MKAMVLTRYGSPKDLRLQEVAKPEPRDHEVMVKVRATTVNDYDWALVRGKPRVYRLIFGLVRPRVKVLGAEVSGTVEATGRDVRGFEPGDHVYGDVSETGFGGFAEYVCTHERALTRKPPDMAFEQAAALPHASMLALQGLVDVGRIRPGERVLINGAGGGVGMIGVQIAKQFGAEVTGVDRDFKLEALRSIGFDHVIDYQRDDFTRGGQRYDLILDTKTTRSPFRYLKALNPGGRYVTVGGDLPRLLQFLCLKPLISATTKKALRIVVLKPNKDLDYVNDLFEKSGLKFLIDGPYPLEDVAQAIQRFGDAGHIGKIVITIAD